MKDGICANKHQIDIDTKMSKYVRRLNNAVKRIQLSCARYAPGAVN